jgi:hypothetical protein
MLRKWLLADAPMDRMVHTAQQLWGLGRRSVQLYLKEIKAEMAKEASEDDYLAHLWKSKLQHEGYLHRINRDLERTDDPKAAANLLRLAATYLKQRDLTMASVFEHRRWAKRDTSPDSVRAKNNRSGMVIMPMSELNWRIDTLRQGWFEEFQKHFQEINGLAEMPPVWIDGKMVLPGYEPPPGTPKAKLVPPPMGWRNSWEDIETQIREGNQ